MSNPKLPPEFWPFVQQARARFGRLTPLRLGMLVGAAGADLPAPYAEGTQALVTYREGLEFGKKQRAREAPPEGP